MLCPFGCNKICHSEKVPMHQPKLQELQNNNCPASFHCIGAEPDCWGHSYAPQIALRYLSVCTFLSTSDFKGTEHKPQAAICRPARKAKLWLGRLVGGRSAVTGAVRVCAGAVTGQGDGTGRGGCIALVRAKAARRPFMHQIAPSPTRGFPVLSRPPFLLLPQTQDGLKVPPFLQVNTLGVSIWRKRKHFREG